MKESKDEDETRRRELDEIHERGESEDPYRPLWQLSLISIGLFLQTVILLPLAVGLFVLSGLAALVARDGYVFDTGAGLASSLICRSWVGFLVVVGVTFSVLHSRVGRALRRNSDTV